MAGALYEGTYEQLKHSGKYPLIGVNTFLSAEGSPAIMPREVIRATEEEKEQQISMILNLVGSIEGVCRFCILHLKMWSEVYE